MVCVHVLVQILLLMLLLSLLQLLLLLPLLLLHMLRGMTGHLVTRTHTHTDGARTDRGTRHRHRHGRQFSNLGNPKSPPKVATCCSHNPSAEAESYFSDGCLQWQRRQLGQARPPQSVRGDGADIKAAAPHRVQGASRRLFGLRQRGYEVHLPAGYIKVENQVRGGAVGTKLPIRLARLRGDRRTIGHSPAYAGHRHDAHVHGYALLALATHRQDAIELLDVLALLADGGEVRHKYVLQLLANDLVLLSNAEISLMPQSQTIHPPTQTHLPAAC